MSSNFGAWRVALAAGGLALVSVGCGDDEALGASSVPPSVASSEPADLSLLGTWTGDRERIMVDEYHQGTSTLDVTEQNGLTFTATFTFSIPGGEDSEVVVGAFTPDGTLMYAASEEGVISFDMIDADTLDYCYVAPGDNLRTSCARLEKQD